MESGVLHQTQHELPQPGTALEVRTGLLKFQASGGVLCYSERLVLVWCLMKEALVFSINSTCLSLTPLGARYDYFPFYTLSRKESFCLSLGTASLRYQVTAWGSHLQSLPKSPDRKHFVFCLCL